VEVPMRIPRLIAAVLLVLALATQARAQDEAINEAGPLAQPFTGRSLAQYIKTAALTPDQAAAARSLHQGYRAAYMAATKKTRSKTEDLAKDMREKNDWQKFAQERGKLTVEYVDQARALEKTLLEDLRALTTPEQAPRVDAAERARRRETGMLLSLGHGERLDLISMLEAQKTDPASSPALTELVSRWEQDVDRLLIEKDKIVFTGMRDMMGEQGGERMDKISKLMSDVVAICTRIGDANRRAATEAQQLLPQDKQAPFALDTKLRTYPRIYGPSYINNAITAAKKYNDLTPDQRTKLTDLAAAYQREADPINTRWASAADQKVHDMPANPMEVIMQFERGQADPSDPFVAARTDRKNLDDRYKAKLKEILTTPQSDQLPKDESRSRGIPEFLPDFEADWKSNWEQWKGEGD
jgi:Spy/CpxP family protein refolding chaperone